MPKSLQPTGVIATYDYYPFGMLMPERYAEDTGTQCAMVTRYRKVMVWQTTQTLNSGTASLSSFTPDLSTLSANGNGVQVQSPGLGGGATATLGQAAAGQQLEVTVSVTTQSTAPQLVLLVDNAAVAATTTGYSGGSYTLTATAPTSGAVTLYAGGASNFTVGLVTFRKFEEQTKAYVVRDCNADTLLSRDYAFGFNGQMKDNEIRGKGNSLEFKFREYDARQGRFVSVDPLRTVYPWNSTYAFAENDVISCMDLEGREKLKMTCINQTTRTAVIKIIKEI